MTKMEKVATGAVLLWIAACYYLSSRCFEKAAYYAKKAESKKEET